MSNRQLASSGGGLREKQIRDVRARDEQQEQDGTEQHVERRAHAAREEGLEGDGGGVRHQIIALLVGVANDVSSDRAEIRVRLRSAHTVAHPAQGREVVRRSVAVHWIELRRYPQFDSRRKLKSGGHHADDRVTAILDAERERREPRRRPEILRPVRMAHDGGRSGADMEIVRCKSAPEHRSDSDGLEEVAAHARHEAARRLRASGDRPRIGRVFRHRTEGVISLAEVAEVRIRKTGIPATMVDFRHRHEPIRPRVGQGPEQHPIDDAEDGRRCADSKRQRKDDDSRHACVLRDHSNGMAEVEK